MDTEDIEEIERTLLVPSMKLAERLAPMAARVTKIYFDALRKEGFSEEQAIQIACSTDLMKTRAESS